ncbi:MAG TPA: flagellin hook IN motif-containing protein, partial [Thermoguttaceae bacterium]|nr:flagellin hook IN motif-containing protein [Thermoguttaceae bacterium]
DAATRATLVYTGSAIDEVTADATITITGDLGSDAISMAEFDSLDSVATKINDLSYKTGVSATVDLVAHTLTLSSDNYGSRADVAVVVDSGTFAVTGGNGDGTANGTNASAEINGITYDGTTSGSVDGSRFTVNQGGFRYQIAFFDGFTGTFGDVTVGGEALTFALSEDVGRRSTLAIQGVLTGQLGGSAGRLSQLVDGGSLSLATLNGAGKNSSDALRVVDQALADLTRIEGSVDGFYNAAISSASGLLTDLEEDLGTSIDAINLTNDTEESVKVAYFQDLAANAVAGLSILSYQRSSIVAMIQQIAGLG